MKQKLLSICLVILLGASLVGFGWGTSKNIPVEPTDVVITDSWYPPVGAAGTVTIMNFNGDLLEVHGKARIVAVSMFHVTFVVPYFASGPHITISGLPYKIEYKE